MFAAIEKNPVNLSFMKQNFNSLVNVETLCSSKFWPARQKLLLVQIYTKEGSPIDWCFCCECNPPSCATVSLK